MADNALVGRTKRIHPASGLNIASPRTPVVIVVLLAGLLNAVTRRGGSWTEQRVVVFGAGTAGVGIADQIRDQMVRHGLSKEDATRRIWLVDLPGLLMADMTDGLLDFQRPYARPRGK